MSISRIQSDTFVRLTQTDLLLLFSHFLTFLFPANLTKFNEEPFSGTTWLSFPIIIFEKKFPTILIDISDAKD